MVTIDSIRCTYCGGCVSVCPEDALFLAETHLSVNENCIDCGDCVSACPVGALSLVGDDQLQLSLPSNRSYDLVVVGAGPGGSTAAFVAAQAGLSVLLIEKRQEIGSPVRCAEGIEKDALLEFIEPDPLWVASEVTQAAITTVHNGREETWKGTGGRGYILERLIFDRVLAERAAQQSAEVCVKTSVTGLLTENERVRGVKIQHGGYLYGAGEVEVEAKVVIAADGVEAQIGRWAGLSNTLPLKDRMVCVQYLLAGVEINPTCTSYVIDNDIAPGGYAWIFPKGNSKANVGLGVQADIWQHLVDQKFNNSLPKVGEGTVLEFLTRFIESDSDLEKGFPVTLITGNVPVAPPAKSLVKDGLMLVGDAARQVDPLTGGGIINAMTAGRLAAQVAVNAIAEGNTSSSNLKRYETIWQQTTGRKLLRNYRLREKFPPSKRTDKRFMRAFALAVGG